MCRPHLSDALPMADKLCELAPRLTTPTDIATAYASAATLRHLHELAVSDEACSIDLHDLSVVAAALQRVRALAQTEAATGKPEWTRAILLIDHAIEALEP